MTQHTTKPARPPLRTAEASRSRPIRVVSRIDTRLARFTAAPPDTPANQPVTNATWAFSVRRSVRVAVWALPLYALIFGAATFGSLEGGPAPYLADGSPLHLLGWVAAIWLGLVALVALAGVQVVARTRRTAAGAMMLGIAGAALLLPFAALTADTRVYGFEAGTLSLAGAGVYSLGWLLMGWAVRGSGLFSRGDGGLLMVAAPMLGVGGLLFGPLQTVGALLALAGGVGIGCSAGRLLPTAVRVTDPAAGPVPAATAPAPTGPAATAAAAVALAAGAPAAAVAMVAGTDSGAIRVAGPGTLAAP